MKAKTPLTLITGSLGSGKTTLLKHIIGIIPYKIAILMNEFGEIAIDSKIIKGKNVEMTELAGGCVCCSLIGEFEAAVCEIIDTVDPGFIIVETTGIAEPDALIFDIQESLPQIRLDGIVTIVDADMMTRYPQLGHTTRMQIEDADVLMLNKTDLSSKSKLQQIEKKLRELNPKAPIIHTDHCQVDSDILFGISREKEVRQRPHKHQLEYQSASYRSDKKLNLKAFKTFVGGLGDNICRAKGFANFTDGTSLFNYVNGRWELEPHEKEETALVFIGKDLDTKSLINKLKACEC